MDIEVQVMASNKVIDRIRCPVQFVEGQAVVVYKENLCFVRNGYIDVKDGPSMQFEIFYSRLDGWAKIFSEFICEVWPFGVSECCNLLKARFLNYLPDKLVNAAAVLSCEGYDVAAKKLLFDFLMDHQDSEKMMVDIRCAWGMGRREVVHFSRETIGQPDAFEFESLDVYDSSAKLSKETDDMREVTKELQSSIGAFVAKEEGASIFGLDEMPDDEVWDINLINTPPQVKQTDAVGEVLLSRLAALGREALDVLQYFADNPGDKPVHAEAVLGYSKHNIQKMLSGLLDRYVEKNDLGGWECYDWVPALLSGIDQTE